MSEQQKAPDPGQGRGHKRSKEIIGDNGTEVKSQFSPNMVLLRQRKNENFKTIDLHPIQNDTSLSWKAKGLHTYLISRPPGWKIRYTDLIKRASDGQAALRAAVSELKERGYLRIDRERNPDGTLGDSVWTITENPQTLPLPSFPPDVDFPHVDNPRVDNQQGTKKYGSKKELKKEEEEGRAKFQHSPEGENGEHPPPPFASLSEEQKPSARDEVSALIEHYWEAFRNSGKPGLKVDKTTPAKLAEAIDQHGAEKLKTLLSFAANGFKPADDWWEGRAWTLSVILSQLPDIEAQMPRQNGPRITAEAANALDQWRSMLDPVKSGDVSPAEWAEAQDLGIVRRVRQAAAFRWVDLDRGDLEEYARKGARLKEKGADDEPQLLDWMLKADKQRVFDEDGCEIL